VPVDGDPADMPKMGESTPTSAAACALAWPRCWAVAITLVALPDSSPLRASHREPHRQRAPLMKSIVPLIFILFLLPGLAHGYVAKASSPPTATS
jgi:aminobenzoyl-glutamate transport protein